MSKQWTPTQNDAEVIYYWPKGYASFARGIVLDTAQRPFSRLSTTLLLSLDEPFKLDAGDGPTTKSKAALIGPQVPRRLLDGRDSSLVILDFSPATPEYAALESFLRNSEILFFEPDLQEAIHNDLKDGFSGELSTQTLRTRIDDILPHVAGRKLQPVNLDPRVAKAMEIIEDTPLNELSLADLATQVHLSTSRLRHLFVEELGFTITQYARWCAMQRSVLSWAQGQPMVEAAISAGLHDSSHANRVLKETLGRNPSEFNDSSRFKTIVCDWQ